MPWPSVTSSTSTSPSSASVPAGSLVAVGMTATPGDGLVTPYALISGTRGMLTPLSGSATVNGIAVMTVEPLEPPPPPEDELELSPGSDVIGGGTLYADPRSTAERQPATASLAI